MKKKYLVSGISTVILLGTLLGIVFRTKEFDDFFDYTVVDKIAFVDGESGKVTTIKNKESIAKFKEYMDNVQFRRKISASKNEYEELIDLYYGMNVEIRFTVYKDHVKIDNRNYSMSNHNDRPLPEFLESLKNQ